MNIEELKEGICLIAYDIPSPDNWRKNFNVIYNLRINSTERAVLNEASIFLKDYLGRIIKVKKGKVQGKIVEEKIDGFEFLGQIDENGKYAEGKERKFAHIVELLNNIKLHYTDYENFSLFLNNKEVLDDSVKKIYIDQVRDKLPSPKSIYDKDLWTKLSRSQSKHNRIVKDGREGLLNRNGDLVYPLMKNEEFIYDNNPLKIRWGVSLPVFDEDSDIITNPKYLTAQRRLDLGEIKKIPKHIKPELSIKNIFESARGSLNDRLKSYYISNKQSEYTLTIKKAFVPNDIKVVSDFIRDNKGNWSKVDIDEPFYNPQKPRAKFTWDVNTGEYIPNLDANGDPIPTRMPYDEGANHFEEIFYNEILPIYIVLNKFVRDEEKQKILFEFKPYRDKLSQSFEDWVSFIKFKSVSNEELDDLMNELSKSQLRGNPKIFKDLSEVIKERYIEYVVNDKKFTKHHNNFWIPNKKQDYMRIIENYPQTDVITPQTLDRFMAGYNKNIKLINKEKGESFPILKDITEAEEFLNALGWYYSIPNNFFESKLELKEREDVVTVRKQIEKRLHEIEEKSRREEERIEDTSLIVKTRLNKQDIINQMDANDIDGLIAIYEDLLTNPELYLSPREYKKWLEEVIPTKRLPKINEKEVMKKIEEIEKETRREDLAREEEQEKIRKKFIDPKKIKEKT